MSAVEGVALELGALSYTKVESLLADKRRSVALIPTGSTEAHGPHLPLATDSIISTGMAQAAAAALAKLRFIAVTFPCLHYAVTDWAAAFKGSTGLQTTTAQAMLLETLVAAKRMGFDCVVMCNAHLEPDNIATLRTVAKRFFETTGAPLVFPDVTRRRVAEQLTEEFQSGSCHAGQYETSIVMALRPELVDEQAAQALPEHFVPLHEKIAGGAQDFLECGLDQAYCGAPAKATAQEGRETLATLARVTTEHVLAYFATMNEAEATAY